MRFATRLSLVVGSVLMGGASSCTSELCETVEQEVDTPSQSDHSLSRDELCSLERDRKLDVFIASDRTNLNVNPPSPESCGVLCGDVEARECLPGNESHLDYRPEDAAAPSGECPFADAVGELTLKCIVTTRRTIGSVTVCQSKTNVPPLSVGCSSDKSTSHGRRPEGYEAVASAPDAPRVGAYFAACAHLEAASVIAFEALRDELAAYDFPCRVLDACTRAAAEEVAHADVVHRLALRFGGEALPLSVIRRTVPRLLVDIAIENAVEGCVGEVFGAAEAAFCAQRAEDGQVRASFERIAAEEAGHAELSNWIGELVDCRLDAAERARVRGAGVRARRELRDALGRRETHPEIARHAGVPHRTEALALFDAIDEAFWAPWLGA